MDIKLTSGDVSCVINYHGAELKSLNKNGVEYMWCADPAYWNRTSPVLFPFVGQVAGGVFRYKGSEYPMGQHGFARDMDFELVESSESHALFRLVSNEETLKKYPMPFILDIGYKLDGARLTVSWGVTNPCKAASSGSDEADSTCPCAADSAASGDLYFSIGAHPAFNCTLSDSEFRIYKDGKPVEKPIRHLFGPGLVTGEKIPIDLPGGVISMDEHTYDGDAFVFEDYQVDKVELLTKDGVKKVAVEFTSPLIGLWSPPKKNAPFVCIEPWYGRADRIGFEGELADREWGQTLKPQENFNVEYVIEVF